MQPEDVVDALSHMIEAVKPGGLILDLQIIRPNPAIDTHDVVVGEIDGEPLFRGADSATAAIDGRIQAGDLVEEAVDDHDVRWHYTDGVDLVDDWTGGKRELEPELVPVVAAITEPLVVRERCRLRRLRVPG